MSLHRVGQAQNGAPVMAAATYASELAAGVLPEHRMPDADVSANVAHSIVHIMADLWRSPEAATGDALVVMLSS